MPSSREVVSPYLAAVQAGDEPAIRELFSENATRQLRGELPISGLWQGRGVMLYA